MKNDCMLHHAACVFSCVFPNFWFKKLCRFCVKTVLISCETGHDDRSRGTAVDGRQRAVRLLGGVGGRRDPGGTIVPKVASKRQSQNKMSQDEE